MSAVRAPLVDVAGTVVRVGDTVRQANATGHPWWGHRGALMANSGGTGVVVALGRTRAVVNFGRMKTRVSGYVSTSEPALDAVHASMLLVVSSPGGEWPSRELCSCPRKLSHHGS